MKIFIPIIFIISQANLFGQQINDTSNFSRFQYGLEIGGHYLYNFDGRYIPAQIIYPREVFYPYAGYLLSNSLGFQFGVVVNYKLTQRIILKSGLIYYKRKRLLDSDTSILKKYYDNYLTVSYDYSLHNFEIPLFLGYTSKHIEFTIGFKIRILSINNTKKRDAFGNEYAATNESFQRKVIFRPDLRFYYLVNIKNFKLKPYVGIDKDFLNTFNFQVGVEFLTRN